MQKTSFKDVEFLVSTNYNRTYVEYLESEGIEYTKRTIPIFQSLLPRDILSYGGYEIAHKDEDGEQIYVYIFVTQKADFTKCVSFFPKDKTNKLDNLYLLDLEQALRTEKLVYENTELFSNQFGGFNFSEEIKPEDLIDKVVLLDNGSRYEFSGLCTFPEGVTGKKILPSGDAVKVFLCKTEQPELTFLLFEADGGWQTMNKEQIISVFGER